MRVLITYGGMLEKIDGVRAISNSSSGRTGVIIANHFFDCGAQVDCLKGKNAFSCKEGINTSTFIGFDDLEKQLAHALKSSAYDAVIHLAAVSDYRVNTVIVDEKIFSPALLEKIDSDGEVVIKLTKTPKLITMIKDISPKSVLVGFKLTNTEKKSKRLAAVEKLQSHSHADYIVHNDLSEISEHCHKTTIYSDLEICSEWQTKELLAAAIFNLVERRLS